MRPICKLDFTSEGQGGVEFLPQHSRQYLAGLDLQVQTAHLHSVPKGQPTKANLTVKNHTEMCKKKDC